MRSLMRLMLIGAALLTAKALATAQEAEPMYKGKKLSEWVALLPSKDSKLSQEALDATRKIGSRAVPVLIEKLKDKDPAMRTAVAYTLGGLREKGKSAAPALLDALKDTDARVRAGAATALGYIDAD